MDCKEYDLVAFGCSFTYGHGLIDCIADDGISHGPKPSAIAWPNCLKSIANFRTVENMAIAGSSNKMIAKEVIEYKKYTKKTFVAILWSNFDRHTVYKNREDKLHIMPAFIHREMPRAFWDWHGAEQDEFKRLTKSYYADFHEDFDVYFDQMIRMNYIHSWLKDKGIQNIHMFAEHLKPYGLNEHKRYFNNFNVRDIRAKVFTWHKEFAIDKALDKPAPHPGPASHKFFAHNIKKWFLS